MTTVSEAVATREQTAKPASVSLVEVATTIVDEQLPRFQAVLPRGFDETRFKNLTVAAVRRTPDLARCFATPRGRASLLIAAIQCASIGLEPNTPLREAALVPRKRKGVDECQLIIEYRGLIKLALRSERVSTITAEVVHQRDHFVYRLGTDPIIEHTPYDGDDDPGPLRYTYCVTTLRDGATQFVVVPRRVVYAQHRARSDSYRSEKSRPYSPWTTDEESMWRKTAVRVAERFLPLSAETRIALDSDERSFDIEGEAIVPYGSLESDTIIDVAAADVAEPDPPPPAAAEPKKRRPARAKAAAKTTAPEPDPEPPPVDDDGAQGTLTADDVDAAWVADAKGDQP